MFVNPTLDDALAKAAEDESLTMIQLHGDEGAALLPRGGSPDRLPRSSRQSEFAARPKFAPPRRFAPTSISSTRTGPALVTDPLAGLAWYASHFIRIARAPKRMPR